MADYIEREKILRKLRGECLAHYPSYCIMGILSAANEVANIPAADVRPVVRGKWTLFARRGIYGVMYECSACHAKYDGITNFCPNCGADMRKES